MNHVLEQILQRVQAAKGSPNSPEFKRWFRKSKVVDSKGKPLMVFHGTTADFHTFKSTIIWCAVDPVLANKYSAEFEKEFLDDSNVMPLFMSVQNPLQLSMNLNSITTLEAAKIFTHLDFNPKFKTRANKGLRYLFTFVNTPEFVASAKSKGYDGIHAWEGKYETWGAFESTQVKSAIGNNGKFDLRNPSVLASLV